MKPLFISLVFILLFMMFGFYIHHSLLDFKSHYESKITLIEEYITQEDWDSAKLEVDKYYKSFDKDKNIWYMILNHEYFEDILLSLNTLSKSIDCKDKVISFTQIELIKNCLSDLIRSENSSLNYIF